MHFNRNQEQELKTRQKHQELKSTSTQKTKLQKHAKPKEPTTQNWLKTELGARICITPQQNRVDFPALSFKQRAKNETKIKTPETGNGSKNHPNTPNKARKKQKLNKLHLA